MPGRPDFSAAGSQGSGQTVAINQRPELQLVDATQTGSVASGATEYIRIYAPSGSIYQSVVAFAVDINRPGGTSGYHRLDGRSLEISEGQGWRASADRSDSLSYQYSAWGGTKSQIPADDNVMYRAIRDLMATENEPILLQYKNRTDTEQTSDRKIRFGLKEVSY